jgi:hypothetical protein
VSALFGSGLLRLVTPLAADSGPFAFAKACIFLAAPVAMLGGMTSGTMLTLALTGALRLRVRC